MTLTTRRWLTLGATLGYVHWFFGNLYEAVVFSPNWVIDSPAQLTRLNELFIRTSPTLYFVPVIVAASLLLWALTLLTTDVSVRPSYRRASLFAVLALALNGFIVATIVSQLFGGAYRSHPEKLNAYCWRWNILNAARMALVATTAAHLFSAYRKLDRAATPR